MLNNQITDFIIDSFLNLIDFICRPLSKNIDSKENKRVLKFYSTPADRIRILSKKWSILMSVRLTAFDSQGENEIDFRGFNEFIMEDEVFLKLYYKCNRRFVTIFVDFCDYNKMEDKIVFRKILEYLSNPIKFKEISALKNFDRWTPIDSYWKAIHEGYKVGERLNGKSDQLIELYSRKVIQYSRFGFEERDNHIVRMLMTGDIVINEASNFLRFWKFFTIREVQLEVSKWIEMYDGQMDNSILCRVTNAAEAHYHDPENNYSIFDIPSSWILASN